MRILVTGGAGFIGSNFLLYWSKNYPKDFLVNLDLLTYAGHLESLKELKDNPRYVFVQGDICDENKVSELIDEHNIDTIIHFAAESHVDRSILDPMVFVKTNVLGTANLLNIALKHNLRFHHVSTDEVYGSLDLDTSEKFSESSPYHPNSPYSASKAGSDHLVRAYFTTYGLPITITNCSNNFGPYQDTEKFLPRMITNLLEGEKVKIYGDGKNVRDWLFVEDHCRAIDLVVKNGKVGETYLVGGLTDDISNLDLARMVLKIMGEADDKIEFVRDRAGHDRRYAVDWKKIKNELNWAPEKNFNQRLIETINWYKENQWWWKPIKSGSEIIYKNQK